MTVWSLLYIVLLLPLCKAAEFQWSHDFKDVAARTSCKAGELIQKVKLKNDSQPIMSQLGKVANIQVCSILCCETDYCDLAILSGDSRCTAVKCATSQSCAYETSEENSVFVKFTRTSGSDVWTSGEGNDTVQASSLVNENKTQIITKQAAVQKNSIPEQQPSSNEQKSGASVITLSNKSESPMDALLRKEASMVRSKQIKNDALSKKENMEKKVGDKIQDITEHYLKAQEKSEITSLQENETTAVHTKLLHRRQDLRHTLISPITIGAFTCMAVIAVSGFAMAIIKYQRERKDYEDKQTQKP